mgnify:CR=1 FL=1
MERTTIRANEWDHGPIRYVRDGDEPLCRTNLVGLRVVQSRRNLYGETRELASIYEDIKDVIPVFENGDVDEDRV